MTTEKALFEIPAGATFEEYVDLAAPEDTVSEVMIDPFSMQGMGSSKQAKHDEDNSAVPDGLFLPEVGAIMQLFQIAAPRLVYLSQYDVL